MLAELSQAVINRCNRDIFDALKETASFQVAHAMDIQTCFHDAAAGFSLSFTHDPLLQKLNNPSLSTMPALHHIRNYILSPEEYLTLQTQILTELRDAFSDFIKLLDRLKTYPTASSPSITATEFCNQYSTNSYIYTPSSIRNFLTGTPMGTSLNKIAIDGFSRQVCLDLQTDTAKITPKSNSEIEATVSAHFMP